MATLGRNDPCHCGSGKKYKKCCIEKDADAARTAAAAARVTPPEPERTRPPSSLPVSPEPNEWDAFIEKYSVASLDQRVSLALEAVRSEPAFDSNWSYELLSELIDPLLDAGRDEALRSIADEIVARHPSHIDECAEIGYTRARLAIRRGEDATPFVLEMARADAGAYVAELLYGELRYVGQPASVEAALVYGREHAKENVVFGVLDGELEVSLIIDRFLAANPTIAGTDATLIATVGRCIKLDDPSFLADIIEHASGRARDKLHISDFAGSDSKRSRNARLLSHQWAFEMNARGLWPRSRVELARDLLAGFAKQQTRAAKEPSFNAMIPTPKLIEAFVASLESVHDIAAMAAALPSWCAFLAARGLVKPAAAEQAVAQLRAARGDVRRWLIGASPATREQLDADVTTAWAQA